VCPSIIINPPHIIRGKGRLLTIDPAPFTLGPVAAVKIAAAILGPAAFWIGYFYYKDRFQPEPLVNLLVSFALGFASGFLCYKFYGLLEAAGLLPGLQAVLSRTTRMEFFSYSVVFIGLIEEAFKYLPFVLVVLRFRAFDERIDGIVYAAALAVGFASFENLGYLPLMKGVAFIGRAFASPLTHTVFSSIWGYAVGRAYLAKRSIIGASVLGLGLAGLAHGLFDYLTYSHTLRFLSALLILALWAWGIRMLERREGASPAPPAQAGPGSS
jgi:RsiW-degrading membrane proteinase PrsW (M82 family)